MTNPLADFVSIRINERLRKGTAIEDISKASGIPVSRLNRLIKGDIPTKDEAEGLKEALGGEALDYRPFKIANSAWWAEQKPEVQAETQHLVDQALYAPSKLLEIEKAFSKRNFQIAIVAFAFALLCLGHTVYKTFQVRNLRKEAYTWAIRTTGSRHMAYAQVGIEISKDQILKMEAIEPLIDQTWQDPAERAHSRRVLLDIIHYYVATGAQFEEMLAHTKKLAGDPDSWRLSSRIKDPITGQIINVEDPNGGGIDMKQLKALVAKDLRTQSFINLANAVANGQQDPKEVPPLQSWTKIEKDADSSQPSN